MIKEWNLLRTIACLCIVFLHSTTRIGYIVGNPQNTVYNFGRVLLCYATPTFIVLSIIILANRYPNSLPTNFWLKRIKWLVLPYLSFGIIDALVGKHIDPSSVLTQRIIVNIFRGSFEGWFILVILQFYIIHHIVTRFKLSMKWLFPLSLVIMIVYLKKGLMFFVGYEDLFKLPFLAWFGYFTIAFIIGKHYGVIAEKLVKYRWLTLCLPVISVGIIYLSYKTGNTIIHSRRLDLYPLVLSVTAVVLAWGQVIPNTKFIDLISRYSFGIYLLHWQLQRLLDSYVVNFFTHFRTQALALFILSLLGSILIIRVLTFVPFGSFIVGNVRKKKTTSFRTEHGKATAA
ncbi:acyltransferase family protein [Neobacillus novalis]|uniref:Acyltransferase family protein n=1 Tax=Neobacillus novalis TaxID=220687 RepID=A0AA95MKU2_9BACI|nr:acyltransferase family protein [Neobacillus novalis]WHY83963.1 acyltransferase family protein [Neobacillus novalis]